MPLNTTLQFLNEPLSLLLEELLLLLLSHKHSGRKLRISLSKFLPLLSRHAFQLLQGKVFLLLTVDGVQSSVSKVESAEVETVFDLA